MNLGNWWVTLRRGEASNFIPTAGPVGLPRLPIGHKVEKVTQSPHTDIISHKPAKCNEEQHSSFLVFLLTAPLSYPTPPPPTARHTREAVKYGSAGACTLETQLVTLKFPLPPDRLYTATPQKKK